jgi:hypothetical protein
VHANLKEGGKGNLERRESKKRVAIRQLRKEEGGSKRKQQ